MAINKNHEFEDLNGIKCAVVEKNAAQERVDFLKPLLECNGFTVVVVPSPPPKVAAASKPAEGEAVVEAPSTVPPPPKVAAASKPAEGEAVVEAPSTVPPPPSTFTIGVTDVRFNVTNALMGRMLKTKERKIVTVDFWNQRESLSNDNIPYFANDEYIHSWK